MNNINVRRYRYGDAKGAYEVLKKDVLTENIKDYPIEEIQKIINTHGEEVFEERSKVFHSYVFTDNDKIVGIGMIGPYWDSLTDSCLFTIFRDPDYARMGLGRKIMETLEQDEYFKRADRVEIPASITAVEFYKHFGYGFKRTNKELGHIVSDEYMYRMEKYPKISNNNVDLNQYNMRPYIDNEYHNYKEFIYNVKKDAYKKYVEECCGTWVEEDQRQSFENFINRVEKDAWIIQLNGVDIGFYNGKHLKDGSYEIENICIVSEYRGRGIGTQVLKDVIELHKDKDIHIQYFKQNPVGSLCKKLGFVSNGETEFHYHMIKPKQELLRK